MQPFKPFRFLEWQVYKDSQKLFWDIRDFVDRLPRQYRFDIGSQAIRSSLSVVLNIAEGSGKRSAKEVSRFLDIVIGSLHETRAVLDTLQKDPRASFGVPEDIFPVFDGIRKQLSGFCRSLNK